MLAHRLQKVDCSRRDVDPSKSPIGTFRSYTRGRYALGEAYRLTGLGSGKALLAPAYHCLTMLDPAIALGAEVQLYPLKPDLSPDLEKLDHVFESAHGAVKTLLATHYFGLAQDFTRLKAWCDARNIALVEDCSHVLFTETYQAAGTGTFGKFVGSSPYKFIACEDGGLLHARERRLLDDVTTKSQSLINELRGLKRSLEKRWTRCAPLPDIEQMGIQLTSLEDALAATADLQYSEYLHTSSQFSRAEASKSALRTSLWHERMSSTEFIAKQRKQNYKRWLEAVAGLPNCRALYPRWPDESIPYMFPLLIDHPNPHFFWLKQLGMPIWRWDEMAVSDCAVSRRYQLHLLHLPCHQGLNEKELSWMFAVVQLVLRCDPRTGFSHR